MDPELAKAMAYAQRLTDAALALVGASRIELNRDWARNPKIVALTILCRSMSNFRASLLLAQQEQVLEARVLVRLLYENLLWIGALRERGSAFVEDMVKDDAFNRRALGEVTLRLTSKHGADLTGEGALKLRNIIKELDQQFPKAKKLNAAQTAAEGSVDLAYGMYGALSLDAVHCSMTALGRHVSSEHSVCRNELIVSVVPRTSPAEVLSTVLHACSALLATAIATNEFVEEATANEALASMLNEFDANGWWKTVNQPT